MAKRFAELMFSPAAKAMQAEAGSRDSYARLAAPGTPANDRFGAREREFLAARDSFYMATVSANGWPYVQHRGGPPGFLRLLDDRTLSFADRPGNRQFVSLGNLATDDRVSLILMDYPNRRRLKILGHARRVIDPGESTTGTMLVNLEGFDWNCPQYITPRYTEAEMIELLAPVRARLAALEQENAELRTARPGHEG